MKKKILIISGGISKERIISLDTGRQVSKELKKNGYLTKIVEPDHNLIEAIESFKPKSDTIHANSFSLCLPLPDGLNGVADKS